MKAFAAGVRTVVHVLVVVAALAGFALSPSPANAQGTESSARGIIRLASQTSWLAAGGEFALTLVVDAPGPATDFEVAVTVHQRVTSRSAFRLTLDGRGRGSVLATTATALAALQPVPGGAVFVRLPADQLRVTRSGVYPVQVELRRNVDREVVDAFTTHLVHVAEPVEGDRLRVATVLPVHAPVGIAPDGERALPPDAAGRISAIARAAMAVPALPLTIAPTPETVRSMSLGGREADRSALADLTAATRSERGARQVTANAYVPLSVPAILAAGLEEELSESIELGSRALAAPLGIRPDPRTWVADVALNAASVDALRAERVDRLVVRESTLEPIPLQVTLAQTFELAGADERTVDAASADDDLARHFTSGVAARDPALAAHHLLADLAVLYFDRPGLSRGVIALPARSWEPTIAFLEAYLTGLASAPMLQGVTLDSFFAQVPAAVGARRTPLVRTLAEEPSSSTSSTRRGAATTSTAPPLSRSGAAIPGRDVRVARDRLESFSGMIDRDNPLNGQLGVHIASALSADLASISARQAYLAGLGARIDEQLATIQVPSERAITLTAREGEIPVSILSSAGYPVRVLVRVESDRLAFSQGARREVVLARRNTTELFQVAARTSGSFPLQVVIESPDGELEVGRTRFTVRSTAASGVGVALSIGAASFLAVWWARHAVRGRRARRLVPADEG